jgi:DHA1 family bicyclomycin/chloramphenicol resistance-like MFS transporter
MSLRDETTPVNPSRVDRRSCHRTDFRDRIIRACRRASTGTHVMELDTMPAQLAGAPHLSVLIALSALAVLPINMFVPSLPGIAQAFDADFALVNVAVAGYAVATAVSHLISGALSDRFGRRPVALGALVIFTIASVGCSAAGSIHAFLVWRLLQSAVIAGYSVALAAIRDTASSEGATASRIGYATSAWAVAPMIGPVVGGILDVHFGWRASFIAFALLGAGGLAMVALGLPETNPRRSASIAVPFKGYGDLIRSARFCAYALCMALSVGTLYVFIGGAPLVAARLGETSSIVLGAYMGMVPAGFMVGSYVVGRAGARRSATWFILAGRLLTCAGLLVGFVSTAAGAAHPLAFFGPCIAVGLGNGLTMPAANARVLSVFPGLAGTASGLAAALTVAGAGFIAFVSGFVVDASNANIAVPATMLVAALLSLGAAVFIARVEGD